MLNKHNGDNMNELEIGTVYEFDYTSAKPSKPIENPITGQLTERYQAKLLYTFHIDRQTKEDNFIVRLNDLKGYLELLKRLETENARRRQAGEKRKSELEKNLEADVAREKPIHFPKSTKRKTKKSRAVDSFYRTYTYDRIDFNGKKIRALLIGKKVTSGGKIITVWLRLSPTKVSQDFVDRLVKKDSKKVSVL